MTKLKDETGNKYGSLTILSFVGSAPARWVCQCECGHMLVVAGTDLRAGRFKSCGCKSPRFTSERVVTHGKSRSRTYRIWHDMKQRCSDVAKGKSRKLYYEKGIRVCIEWLSFERFYKDMGDAPDGMSIDRINGNGNYEPKNCRWASSKTQANNMSSNHMIDFNGKSMTLSEWASEIGVKPNTLLYRIKRGWTLDRALSK